MSTRSVSSWKISDQVAGVPLPGSARGYVEASAATLALEAKQCGSLVEITKADGVAITLPLISACVVGSEFLFVVGVALTADATVTRSGSDTLAGVVLTSADGAASNSATAATVLTFDQSASAVVGNAARVIAGKSGWYVQAVSPVAVGITLA